MVVTKHAELRIMERAGLPKRAVSRAAERALAEGIARGEATGRLRRYMDYVYHVNGSANNVRVWADKVYLFHNTTLITVYNLPNELKSAYKKTKERRKA